MTICTQGGRANEFQMSTIDISIIDHHHVDQFPGRRTCQFYTEFLNGKPFHYHSRPLHFNFDVVIPSTFNWPLFFPGPNPLPSFSFSTQRIILWKLLSPFITDHSALPHPFFLFYFIKRPVHFLRPHLYHAFFFWHISFLVIYYYEFSYTKFPCLVMCYAICIWYFHSHTQNISWT